MADPNQQALEAWRASTRRNREERLASMSPEREAWETQTPVEEVRRRRASGITTQPSTSAATEAVAPAARDSRPMSGSPSQTSTPASTEVATPRSRFTGPRATVMAAEGTPEASNIRTAESVVRRMNDNSFLDMNNPVGTGKNLSEVNAAITARNAARAAAANRSNTRSRPRAARGSEMSADDLNAMVLDRLGKSYEGSPPPSGASVDEARARISSRMSEGMKKGGPVKKMAKGGPVKASVKGMKPAYKMAGGGAARADGCAMRGKTKGRMV